jgi:hypothetical protein
VSAQVDAVRGEVAAGGRRWRFELDCRHGTVAVDFGDARVRLHPHSWKEKRILARFAHLGEAFLKDQFVRLCLDEAATPPAEGPEREALLALALWLNAPGGEPALPLDQRVLAAVTVQVCHAIQSPPAALDGLDAADVELLWRAARGETARPAADQPEGTRIVIVPDRPAATPQESAAVELAPSPAPPAPAVPAAAAEPPRLPAAAPASAASHGGEDEPTSAPPDAASPRGGRFRVSFEAPRRPATRVAAPAPVAPTNGRHGASPTLPSSPVESPAHPWPWPVTGAPSAIPSAAPDAEPRTGAGPSVAAPRSRTESPVPATVAVSLEPTPHVLGLADPLFDELAIRLEQAAGELGIDVES